MDSDGLDAPEPDPVAGACVESTGSTVVDAPDSDPEDTGESVDGAESDGVETSVSDPVPAACEGSVTKTGSDVVDAGDSEPVPAG